VLEETVCLDFFTLLTLRRTRVVVVVVVVVGVVVVVVVVVVGVVVVVAALVESEPTSLVGVGVTGIVVVVVVVVAAAAATAAAAAGSDSALIRWAYRNCCQNGECFVASRCCLFFLSFSLLFAHAHTTPSQRTTSPLGVKWASLTERACDLCQFHAVHSCCAAWIFPHLARTAQLYKREKKRKKSQILFFVGWPFSLCRLLFFKRLFFFPHFFFPLSHRPKVHPRQAARQVPARALCAPACSSPSAAFTAF
jgi:hypothetical protein